MKGDNRAMSTPIQNHACRVAGPTLQCGTGRITWMVKASSRCGRNWHETRDTPCLSVRPCRLLLCPRRQEEECRLKKRKCASFESEEIFPHIRRKVADSRRRKRRRLEPPPPPATVSGDGGALRVEARTVRPRRRRRRVAAACLTLAATFIATRFLWPRANH